MGLEEIRGYGAWKLVKVFVYAFCISELQYTHVILNRDPYFLLLLFFILFYLI